MNLIYITSTFIDTVGGSEFYIKKILENQNNCNAITFIFPSITKNKEYIINDIHYVPVCIEQQVGAGRKGQSIFAKKIIERIRNYFIKDTLNIIHVLSGYLIMNKLRFIDISGFSVKTFITIHNIPPKECVRTWVGDNLVFNIFDLFRIILLKIESLYKINNSFFDGYIVPCDNIKKYFKQHLFSSRSVFVVHHGTDVKRGKKWRDTTQQSMKILSVGGFAPHKNQLLIVEIAKELKRNNINYIWDLVGPIRNERYYSTVLRKIEKYKLTENLIIRHDISGEELEKCYLLSDVYVQPSSAEGFCLAALDAAAYGLPVIGPNVGEIQNIARISNGKCTKLKKKEIYSSISEYYYGKIITEESQSSSQNQIMSEYNWKKVVKQLSNIYTQ